MMKKTKIACILILLFVIAICVVIACVISGHQHPQYYDNGYATINLLSLYDTEDKGRVSETPVNTIYEEYVLQVFEDLSHMYGVEKTVPNVSYFEPHDNIASQYSKGCIYINFKDYDNIDDAKSSIAHELIHYFTDNNVLFGFDYALDDTYLFGHTFNEGITNYFSSKYAPNSNYQYETHVATIIAICYGEENLKNDFFSSDVTKLRANFNNSLKKYYKNQKIDSLTVTPFDIMTSFLNTYAEYTDNQLRINQMLAIEEMLMFYAKEKGYETEVKDEISNFATTHNLPYLLQLIS